MRLGVGKCRCDSACFQDWKVRVVGDQQLATQDGHPSFRCLEGGCAKAWDAAIFASRNRGAGRIQPSLLFRCGAIGTMGHAADEYGFQ